MAYKLKLPCQWQRLYLAFNVVKLTAVPKDSILEQKIMVVPAPVIIDSEEE